MTKNKVVSIVYLAGPIDGVSKGESQDWRKKAYNMLSSRGILSAVPGLETIELTSEQIVDLDNTMIENCDAILVNLNFLNQKGEHRIGTGSLIELGIGFAKGKQIIGYIEGEIPTNFKFLKGMGIRICPSLESAIDNIQDINNDGPF